MGWGINLRSKICLKEIWFQTEKMGIKVENRFETLMLDKTSIKGKHQLK